MTEEELQAIRDRHSKASKGPWENDKNSNYVYSPEQTIANIEAGYGDEYNTIANSRFIAHSWQDIENLLNDNKLLREKLQWHTNINSREWGDYEEPTLPF
jgi:hypothetical protein